MRILTMKVPIDAYVVAVPVLYGCFAMAGLVYKTLTADPEMSTAKYYEKPEAEVVQEANHWKDGIRSMFESRISKHRFGVFNNDVPQ